MSDPESGERLSWPVATLLILLVSVALWGVVAVALLGAWALLGAHVVPLWLNHWARAGRIAAREPG